MIVTRSNIASILTHLKSELALAVDTETTGLRPYHGDGAFAVIVASSEDSYYFEWACNMEVWRPSFMQVAALFEQERLWFLQNAKFDMAMLEGLFGVVPAGIIHDLAVHERILDSTLQQNDFSLDAIAKRYGMEKSAAVDEYIKKHKLFTKVTIPGKDKTETVPHFDRVPREVMAPYACHDGRITFDIGTRQLVRLAESGAEGAPPLDALVENERALTRVVYEMERDGVAVDLDFCRCAAAFESGRRAGLLEEFKALAGVPYVNSAKALTPLFSGVENLKRTATGLVCFDAEALATYRHPLADVILGIRDAKSKADYYNGFLHHADAKGVIHASFNQHMARTGRFSSSAPNLQNLTKPDDHELKDEFIVRRAFRPREGFFFAMFDYDQVEYRLMLDYAGARGLIEKVLGGLDVHQATADLAGITRRQAKTSNFLTIYGGGDAVLASNLGCSLAEARRIRQAIKDAAPETADFIAKAIWTAEQRGWVWNWFGRRFYYPNKNDAYKAPNGIIQGGCADIIKIAMKRVNAYLRPFRSRMVLSIHDELVIECAFGEEHILPEIKRIMETVYPWKLIPLTVGADHSYTSLADKIDGLPERAA